MIISNMLWPVEAPRFVGAGAVGEQAVVADAVEREIWSSAAYQRQEALQRLAAGEMQTDIAQSYGVSHVTIGRLHGPTPPFRRRGSPRGVKRKPNVKPGRSVPSPGTGFRIAPERPDPPAQPWRAHEPSGPWLWR
jgi:hypothetical protein